MVSDHDVVSRKLFAGQIQWEVNHRRQACVARSLLISVGSSVNGVIVLCTLDILRRLKLVRLGLLDKVEHSTTADLYTIIANDMFVLAHVCQDSYESERKRPRDFISDLPIFATHATNLDQPTNAPKLQNCLSSRSISRSTSLKHTATNISPLGVRGMK